MNHFKPPFYLSHPTIQTMAGSLRLRALGCNSLDKITKLEIIEPIKGIKLQVAISATDTCRGPVAILLHGWEGSINSAYVVTTARFLVANGWHVVRINFRDHGETHHLNPGLFYASRLDEVYYAIVKCCQKWPAQPVILCGFSLGGNFALRAALRLSCEQPPGTKLIHVLAVSPLIDPEKTTRAVDQTGFVRSYFLRKWRNSLMKKQKAYPELYDFSDVLKMTRIETITSVLLKRYSPFKDIKDYFETYTLTGSRLAPINLPTTILTARDDPIIPVKDIQDLATGPSLRKIILSYGGHNGFIQGFIKGAWYFNYLKQLAHIQKGVEKPI